MSIHAHSHYSHLFKNREIDSLYIMNALKMFATSMISVFVPIYFYKMGIPIWAIIGFWFLRAGYHIIFSYTSIYLIKKLSDKILMFLGITFLIIYFLSLNYISGMNIIFFVAPALSALYAMFFFSGYHMDFSSVVDKDHKGEEVGLNYVIVDIVKFLTPFIGGVIITGSGFQLTFIIASGILVLSMLPLFFFPKRNFSKEINLKLFNESLKDKSLSNFRKATFGYVVDKMNITTTWPLFIFLAFGSVEVLGIYVSVGLLAGAISTYIAGRLFDKGDSNLSFKITGIGESLMWFIRSLFHTVSPVIFGTHVSSYIFRDAMMSSWTSNYYEIINKKENPGACVFAQEMFYNVARVIVYPVFIILAYFLSIGSFLPISFAIAGLFSLLLILSGK